VRRYPEGRPEPERRTGRPAAPPAEPAAAASGPAAAPASAQTRAQAPAARHGEAEHPAAQDGAADPEHRGQAPAERPAKKAAGGRSRRASVPSWDEIMLGNSRNQE
jgi:hypothetical protein